tara:strand:- start:141808 stop:143061 length:1254 start_codon:yes stop_codon:yes gene_type:complete
MDRTQAPQTRKVKTIDILPPQQFTLKNGGELFLLSQVDDNAVKVDLIFDAGSSKHDKLLSRIVGDLILGGTQTMTSDEINEAIDQLGGFTNIEIGTEEAIVSVLGLRENIIQILKIVTDAIFKASFDEKEINQAVAYRKQRFNVSMEKVSHLARREFIAKIFPNSPYGQLIQRDDFENIDRDDLVTFHSNYYLNALQKVAVVGNLSQGEIDEIIEQTSVFKRNDEPDLKFDYNYTPTEIYSAKKGALQTAVRIGRILFNKQHPDYIDFSILNTILGGYFGSRLMSSIREDKGYTYGIGSGVAQLKDTGYFFISTEVGEEYREATIQAIKAEIEKLQTELVSPEELQLVQNYVTGQLLKNADGPFAQMDRFLSVYKHGLDLSYYNQVLEELNSITPERIMELANMYLSWDQLIIVKAG